jgi:hypothetical protein
MGTCACFSFIREPCRRREGCAPPFPTTNRANAFIPSSTEWNLGASLWRSGWGYSVKVDHLANLRCYLPSASNTTRALIGLPRGVSFDVSRTF